MTLPQTLPLATFIGATAIRATVLLLAAAGSSVMLRRVASASTRHLVWLLALLGLFLLPIVSPLLPRWSVAVMAPAPANTPALAPPAPRQIATTQENAPPISRISDADAVVPARAEAPALPLGALLVGAYLAGVATLLVRLARQQRRLMRVGASAPDVTAREWETTLSAARGELGIRRPVRLVRVGSAMPMTWGSLRPVTAIPVEAESWPAERRDAVLLHELAHVARFDSLWQAVAAVACALYWFHPGVWLAALQLRRESEVACDDRVLLAGARPHAYAGELLAVARSFSAAAAPALAVGMASPSQLESRLRALLDAGRARRAPGWGTRTAAALVTALVLGSLASTQLTRRASPGADATPLSNGTPAHPSTPADRATRITLTGTSETPAATLDAVSPTLLTVAPADAQEGLTGPWQLEPQSFGESRPGLAQLVLGTPRNTYTGTTVDLSRFVGLAGAIPSGTVPAHFELRGEAGTIVFEGEFRGGSGAGTFRFTPAPGFAAALQRRGLGTATPEELVRAVVYDVTLAKADALLAVLSAKPAIDDLTRLIGHHVTPQYVRELASVGYRDVSAEEIIRLSNHSIEIPWIRQVQAVGYRQASVEELIRLRNHDVDVAWIREFQSLGYRDTSVEELIRLKNNGIDLGYVRALQALGYNDVSPEDLIRMRRRGVTPEFIRSENARRGTRLSPEDLIYARARAGG